jgi:hypothetical protein
MAAHVESIPFPSAVRRLLAPSLTRTLLTTLYMAVMRRLSEPRVPRMSEEWLQNYDRLSSQSPE